MIVGSVEILSIANQTQKSDSLKELGSMTLAGNKSLPTKEVGEAEVRLRTINSKGAAVRAVPKGVIQRPLQDDALSVAGSEASAFPRMRLAAVDDTLASTKPPARGSKQLLLAAKTAAPNPAPELGSGRGVTGRRGGRTPGRGGLGRGRGQSTNAGGGRGQSTTDTATKTPGKPSTTEGIGASKQSAEGRRKKVKQTKIFISPGKGGKGKGVIAETKSAVLAGTVTSSEGGGGSGAPDSADGGQADIQVPDGQDTSWPVRVDEKDHKRLCALFGPHTNPTSGPLTADATWSILVAYGDRMLGGGRWLPSPNLLHGNEAGVHWTTTLITTDNVWTETDLRDAVVEIRFPATEADSKVSLERIVSSSVTAVFGKLSYCVRNDGAFAVVPVMGSQALRTLGQSLRYYMCGNSYYTVAAPPELQPRPLWDMCMMPWPVVVKATVAVIAVPRIMLEELYPRAAGRKRDDALLRDLTRAANAIVGSSSLISPESKGRVAAKLAFLALVYNSDAEAMMYRDYIPGCLKLNAAASKAWLPPTVRWSWWDMGKRSCQLVLLREFMALAEALFVMRKMAKIAPAGTATFTPSNIVNSTGHAIRRQNEAFVAFVHLWFGLVVGKLRWAILNIAAFPPPKGDVMSSLLVGFRRLFGRSGPPGTVEVGGEVGMLLSVVGEELLKRSHLLATPMVIATEASIHGWRYLPTATMHLVSVAVPLPIGVLLHYTYNSFVAGEAWGSRSRETGPPAHYDVCVDQEGSVLRDNEAVQAPSTFSHPLGLPVVGPLACSEPKIATHFRALSIETVVIDVFRSCACNERAAVMSRVTSVHNEYLEIWEQWYLRSLNIGLVLQPDYDKWLSNQSSMSKGLITRDPTTGVLSGNSSVMRSFVKREKAITSVGGRSIKNNPAPRIIQGRDVATKINTGDWTWALGKRLAVVYHPGGNFMYASSRSAEEIGNFYDRHACEQEEGKWVAIDCSRWDRSVGPAALHTLNQAYKAAGAPRCLLDAFRDRGKIRHGKTSHGWKYSRAGQVSSGDGDTSSGNGWLHLMLLSNCSAVKAAAVSGDDAIIFTTDVDAVLTQYRAGGMDPVLAPDVDFCSSLFWPTNDGTVLGPKIGRFLAKTFYCVHKFDGGYMPWLRGVCLSLENTCSFVPILRVIVPRLLFLCGVGKVWRGEKYLYKSLAANQHSVVEETWAFMQDRYGLSESDVLAMEEQAAQITIGSTLGGDDWIGLVTRDTLGVMDATSLS